MCVVCVCVCRVPMPLQHFRLRDAPPLHTQLVLCHGNLGRTVNRLGNVAMASWIENELDRHGADRPELTVSDLLVLLERTVDMLDVMGVSRDDMLAHRERIEQMITDMNDD